MDWLLKEGNNSFIFILTKQDKNKLELLKIFLMKSKKFMKKTKEKFLIFCQILIFLHKIKIENFHKKCLELY